MLDVISLQGLAMHFLKLLDTGNHFDKMTI